LLGIYNGREPSSDVRACNQYFSCIGPDSQSYPEDEELEEGKGNYLGVKLMFSILLRFQCKYMRIMNMLC